MAKWITLRNGMQAMLRPLQPGDLYLIDDLHQRLSAQSLYFRYLHPYRPTLAEASRICRNSAQNGGVIAISADHLSALGIVQYSAPISLRAGFAELGIVVDDQVQGQGLGRALLEAAIRRASSRGVSIFHMDVHPANEAMLRLLYETGYPINERLTFGVREVTMVITPNGLKPVYSGAQPAVQYAAAQL